MAKLTANSVLEVNSVCRRYYYRTRIESVEGKTVIINFIDFFSDRLIEEPSATTLLEEDGRILLEFPHLKEFILFECEHLKKMKVVIRKAFYWPVKDAPSSNGITLGNPVTLAII